MPAGYTKGATGFIHYITSDWLMGYINDLYIQVLINPEGKSSG